MAYCGGMGGIAVIGQSLCTGYGSTGYPVDAVDYQPTARGWWAQFEAAHTDTTWYNFAHNGAMVSDFMPGGRWDAAVGAVEEIRATKVNRTIIVLGGNEFFQGIDPRVYRCNLTGLVQRLRGAAAGRIHIVSEYEFPAELAGGTYTQDEYRQTAALVAAVHGATFLDLSCHMPPTSENEDGYYIPDEYGPGQSVHLTDAGHNKMAEVIGAAVLPCPLPG